MARLIVAYRMRQVVVSFVISNDRDGELIRVFQAICDYRFGLCLSVCSGTCLFCNDVFG